MEVMQKGGAAADKPILMQLNHCVRKCRLRGGEEPSTLGPGHILGGWEILGVVTCSASRGMTRMGIGRKKAQSRRRKWNEE